MKAHQLKNAILQLAVQGKLVPQNPNDEPASKLLERIADEKRRRIKAGEIKKDKRDSTIVRRGASFYEIANTTERCIDDELPFDLPNGWEWARIISISSLVTKGTTPKGGKGSYLCSGIGFLRAENVAGLDRLNLSNLNYINESVHLGELQRSILQDNDILITIAGTLGRTALVKTSNLPLNVNQAIAIIRITNHKVIDLSYLIYALNSPSIQEHLNSQRKITAIPNLTLEIISNCIIPIPPLAEQRRIVDRLESLLPLVEAYGKAEAELSELDARFPDMLKKSILQDAVQGKLVPQNPNDEPASVLLERIRAEKRRLIKEGKIKKDKHESVIFRRDNSHYEKLDGVERCIDGEIPFEIPENWGWVRWGSIAESIQYGYNAPAKQEGRIRMVRISDIHENTVAWSSVPFCDIEDSDIPTYLLQPNDILFARTGGTVGKSFLVSEVPCESIYAGYLIRTRYSSLLCPQYLKFFMESPLYWQQLKSGTTATAQPNCNGQTLAKMLFPLPPANEQLRIVKNLVRTFAIIDKM